MQNCENRRSFPTRKFWCIRYSKLISTIKTTLLLSDKKIGRNTTYHSINFPPSPSWLVYLLATKSIALEGVKYQAECLRQIRKHVITW